MRKPKIPPRPLNDDKWLEKSFRKLNHQFFNNEIPGSLRVAFVKDCGVWSENNKNFSRCEAYFDAMRDAIFVDDLLKGFPNLVMLDLIHEMAHAKLFFQGYRGYPSDEGHGTQFQAEIVRLIRIGAYDGLL